MADNDKDNQFAVTSSVGNVIDLSTQSTPFLKKSDEDKLYSPTLAESSGRLARGSSSGSNSSGGSDFLGTGSTSTVARQMMEDERCAFILLLKEFFPCPRQLSVFHQYVLILNCLNKHYTLHGQLE